MSEYFPITQMKREPKWKKWLEILKVTFALIFYLFHKTIEFLFSVVYTILFTFKEFFNYVKRIKRTK